MFLSQGNIRAVSLLHSLSLSGGQSRAVLLLGPEGSGKFSAALDFAQEIFGTDPLSHPDFFCFRNDNYALKIEYFLTKMAHSPLAWNFLKLFQRRMSASILLNETFSGVKVASIKEDLDEFISHNIFPETEKSVKALIDTAKAYDKKKGIPMDIIREAILFHSMHSEHGRISVFGNFDTAEENTQNAALKLLEEPHPKHWLLITASDEKALIPTILSRAITVKFSRPRSGDLSVLEGHKNIFHSSLAVMNEVVYKVSALKIEYLRTFFMDLIPQTDKGIVVFSMAEKLEKSGHTVLFLEELLHVLQDALVMRHSILRGCDLPLANPSYTEFSQKLAKGSSAELEDIAQEIENVKKQVKRPVVKSDNVLPDLFIKIARSVRIFGGR